MKRKKDYFVILASLVLFFSIIPFLILITSIVSYRSGSSDQEIQHDSGLPPHIKAAFEKHEQLLTDPFHSPDLKEAFKDYFREDLVENLPEFNLKEHLELLKKEGEEALTAEAKKKSEEKEKKKFIENLDIKKEVLESIKLQNNLGISIKQYAGKIIPFDALNLACIHYSKHSYLLNSACTHFVNDEARELYRAVKKVIENPISKELLEAFVQHPEESKPVASLFSTLPKAEDTNQMIQNLLKRLKERFPNDQEFYQDLFPLLPIEKEDRENFLKKIFPTDYFLKGLLGMLDSQNGLSRTLSRVIFVNEPFENFKSQFAAYNTRTLALREAALNMMNEEKKDPKMLMMSFYNSIARATYIPLELELVHFLLSSFSDNKFSSVLTKSDLAKFELVKSELAKGPFLAENGKIALVNPDSTIALLLVSIHNCLIEKSLSFPDYQLERLFNYFLPQSLPNPNAFTSYIGEDEGNAIPSYKKYRDNFTYSFKEPKHDLEPLPKFSNGIAFNEESIKISSKEKPTVEDLFGMPDESKPTMEPEITPTSDVSPDGLRFLSEVTESIYSSIYNFSHSSVQRIEYDQFDSKDLGIPGAIQLLFQKRIHGLRSFLETHTKDHRYFVPSIHIDPFTMRLMAKFHSLQLAAGVGITTRLQSNLFNLVRKAYINSLVNDDPAVSNYRNRMGIPMLKYHGAVFGGSNIELPPELLGGKDGDYDRIALRATRLCYLSRLISGFDAYIGFLNSVCEQHNILLLKDLFPRFDANLVDSEKFIDSPQNYFSSKAFEITSPEAVLDASEINKLLLLLRNALSLGPNQLKFILYMKRLFFKLHGSPTFPVRLRGLPLIRIEVKRSDDKVGNYVRLESGKVVVGLAKVGFISANDVFNYLFIDFAND